MTLNIKAFIFDMDGVITDTVTLHWHAWKRMADEAGIPFTQEDNDQLRGLSRRDSLDYVFRGRTLSEAEAEELMNRKNRYFLELVDSMTPDDCLPGVTRLINEARSAGLALGLASSSLNVRPVMTKLGLYSSFDAIGDTLIVARAKPAPDVFIWTAGRLNVAPAHALVFEDSQVGVEGARSGGFWTIGIGDPRIVGAAHAVVPDLSQMTVAAALALAYKAAGSP